MIPWFILKSWVFVLLQSLKIVKKKSSLLQKILCIIKCHIYLQGKVVLNLFFEMCSANFPTSHFRISPDGKSYKKRIIDKTSKWQKFLLLKVISKMRIETNDYAPTDKKKPANFISRLR